MGTTQSTPVQDEQTTANTKWSEHKIGSIISLSSYKFNKETSNWQPKKIQKNNVETKKISFVSYNIWFDYYKKMERIEELMKICKGSDVICLQEVTTSIVKYLKDVDWIQQDYEISDVSGGSVIPYGVLILSKIPVDKFTMTILPSNMARMCLTAHLTVNNETILVGTVHLESLSHRDTRAQQLKLISETMKDNSTNLLMGDFNFDSEKNYLKNDTNPIENENLKNYCSDYIDIWPFLKEEEGKTFDTDLNDMLNPSQNEKMRYDRIILKSKSWNATSIEMLGTEGFEKDDQRNAKVFPSDHFGLKSIIEHQ
jgi:tyrosyl-DNA phosphodiesterase 2